MKHNISMYILLLILFGLASGCLGKLPTEQLTNSIPTLTPKQSTPFNISPTPMIYSTLTAEETRDIALDWLQDNNDCQLPCLWGVTPGITSTQELKDHFAWFSRVDIPGFRTGLADSDEFSQGARNIFVTNQDQMVSVMFVYNDKDGTIEQLNLIADTTQENVQGSKKVFGSPIFNQVLRYYLLPQILSTYGLPSSVLVGAWHDDPFLKAPYSVFSTVVIYYDQGFLIEYISPSRFLPDRIEGCPTEGYIYLWTWDPGKSPSLEDVLSKKLIDEGIASGSLDYFKSIETATSMNLNDFYQTFKDSQTTQCLQTPAALWPKP